MSASPGGTESFAAVLRDRLAELDADEASAGLLTAPDPLDDLRTAALRSVLAAEGRPLPRQGHAAYVQAPQPVASPGAGSVDIRS